MLFHYIAPCVTNGGRVLADIRRKPSLSEEYWLASKDWERKGVPLGTARALANAGFLTVDELLTVQASELVNIPRVGRKSLATLYGLMGGRSTEPFMHPRSRSGRSE